MADGEKKYVPLMMGERVIGVIHFDGETGDISGRLENTEFVTLLNEIFEEGLAEVAFYGKSAIPITEAQKKFNAFLKGENLGDR